MTADLLLTHFNQVFCPNDLGHPLFGAEMKEARVLEDGYIAVKDGKILADYEIGRASCRERV